MTRDTITFTVTAAAAAGSVAAPVSGDSAFVRSTPSEVSAVLTGLWSKSQAGVSTQVTFPYGHDTQRNLRYRNTANNPVNVIPIGVKQMMKSQDLISVLHAGAAVAGDVDLIVLDVAYPELPGGSDKYIDGPTLDSRVEELVTIEDTITPTVASAYSGARAMNQVSLSFKANRDYAVLGGFVGVACGALTIRGQDTGNLRVSLPGNPLTFFETRDWHVRQANWFGMPLIPVINAANQGGTFIEVVQDENLVAVPFSLVLALLAPA